MSAHVYPLAKQSFESKLIDLVNDNIKVVALSSAYTYSATHQFLSDLTGTIATTANLSGKSVANGVFSASNTVFSAVAAGSTITQIVGYQDTGVAATSRLVWINDGFSQATNGGDINVNWDTGANKIFAL